MLNCIQLSIDEYFYFPSSQIKKIMSKLNRFMTCCLLMLLPVAAHAEGADTGDTAWILTSTALVLFMTLPGLALFYGGLVRAKKCPVGFDAVFCDRLRGQCALGDLWL